MPEQTNATSSSRTRVALLTGASRGLGFALTQALAQQGWTLVIDARGEEALKAAQQQLAREYPEARIIACTGDVADPVHQQELAAKVDSVGGLDALINNASILGPSPQPHLFEYPLDILRQVFEVNVLAPLGLIQAVAPYLKPGARILNVTSDAGVEAYPGWGGYGASKAALEQLSNILAAERPDLRVYWVDPGDMRTNLQQQAFPGEDISDRPLPEVSAPGLLRLLDGDLPSGRYQARALASGSSGLDDA